MSLVRLLRSSLVARGAACLSLLATVCLVTPVRATIDSTLQMQTGNPTNATADTSNHSHYLIQRAQFAMDYNDTTREPNWVAWDLTTGDVGGSGRSNFIVDTNLPSGFYQVLTTDYSGSGYDRGHMCPSADRTVDTTNNQAVFVMSNMIPQSPDNNQGVWASFETYCRSLASASNEVLIVSGPSIFGGSKISSGVAIPGYTWKIAVVVPLGSGSAASRIDANTRVIAIKIPNVAGVRNNPWQQYVVAASQIEADTGYTFFSALSSPIATALRAKVDGQTATGAPSITTQPSAQSTAVGGNATFSVTATGDATLTYQWSKDEVDISGATSSTYTLTNVQAAAIGNYTVTVTNSVGSVTSNAAALIVTGLPPTIATAPVAATVSAGSTAIFSVSAGGSAPFTYQWRKGGVNLTNGSNVAGATTATLTITNAQSADAANYDVVVTNNVSSATSTAVALTVNPAAPTITGQPAALTITNGANASFSVTAVGTSPLSYQWRKGGSTLTDSGSISGSTTGMLTIAAAGAANAGSYDVLVTNTVGTATSSAATLTISSAAAGQLAYAGGTYSQNFNTLPTSSSSTTFTLSGTAPFDLTAATVSASGMTGWTAAANTGTLTSLIANTGSGTGGGLYSYGSASSSDRALGSLGSGSVAPRYGLTLVNSTGQPITQFTLSYFGEKWRSGATTTSNTLTFAYGVGATNLTTGTFTNATTLNYASSTTTASGALDGNANRTSVSATITGFTWAANQTLVLRWTDVDDTGSDDGIAIDDLSFSTPVGSAPTVVSTSPTNNATGLLGSTAISVTFNQAVNVADGWFNISSSTNGPVAATVTTTDSTTFTLTPPVSFPNNDTVTVTLNAAQITEKATGALHPASNTTFSFTTAAPVAPSVTTQPTPQTTIDGGNATFSLVAAGTSPLSYQWRKNGVAITGNGTALTATLVLTAVTTADATTYDCVITNSVSSITSNAVALTVTAIAPTITTQPFSKLVATGGTATFTVAASGTAPFTYQWRKGGTPITGNSSATTATLTLTNVSASDAASYDCVVSNAGSPAATSSAATLTVNPGAGAALAWDFGVATPTGLPSGVTGGAITQGNNNGSTTLLTATSASTGYTGATGGNNAGAAARTGALNQAASGSAYFEITLTPDFGKKLSLAGISFGSRSTGTGPQAYAVYTSVDNYAAAVGSGTLTNDSVWRLLTPALTPVTATTSTAITIRIFGYNGTGSAAVSTANWRIDDLSFSLIVETVAIAPSITTQPVAVISTFNSTASFTVVGTGSPAPTYQWRKGGTNLVDGTGIAGSATATLSLTNLPISAAGSYDVVLTNATSSATSSAVLLTVNKAAATVAFGSLAATYDGTAKSVTTTTNPANLAVGVTYSGSSTIPTNAGSYPVVATINDPNYAGTASDTLVIAKAAQIVTFGALPATVNVGVPFTLSATATSAGSVTFSVVSGNATVSGTTATINDTSAVVFRATQAGTSNYNAASADTTVTAVKQNQAITFAALADALATASPITLSATASSALPVTFSVVSGPATISGSTLTLGQGAGTVVVRAAQAGSGAYNAAANVDRSFTVSKGTATVTLGSLAQTYTGSPLSATATTSPTGRTVTFTYNGSSTAPTAVGSYAVVATVNDTNYTGTASGTLVISKATATVTLGSLAQTYTGSPLSATATTSPIGLSVAFTYGGNSTAPTAVGSYAVVATINDSNYTGTASGTLVISKATATVTLGSLAQTYTGSALSVTATTAPTGLTVSFTYGGSSTAPSAVGSYAVVATINDSNYTGTASGTLVISKATATVTLGSLAQTYTGSALSATATTSPTGLTVSFTYGGSSTAPTAVGSYAVVATINDANYTGTASGTLVISKGTATVTLGSLAQTYDSSAKSVTVTTVPAGLTTSVTYAGSATAPSAAGSYAVVATVNDANYTGTVSGTLAIAKAAQTVTFGALPATVSVGVPFTLSATASSGGAVSFSVVSGNATLSGATATISDTSAVTFRATQAGSDNYNSATADTTVTAGKQSQTITFATLADVTTTAAPIALSATASSGLTVTYSLVSGPATISGSTLTLTGAAGTVVVRAAQSGNGTYSAAANVDRSFNVTTALAAPKVVSQPANLSVRIGSAATFNVTVTGTPTPTFQWRKNGAPATVGTATATTQVNPVTGALGVTVATFTIASAQTTDGGSYDVVVSNSQGSLPSSLARLTVAAADEAPVITSQPRNVVAVRGTSTSLTVVATGVPAPTYQWRKDNVAINGATSATLTFASVQTSDAGSYTVIVTNSVASVTSSSANVRIITRSYAGTYFGNIGALGFFAIYVRDDNTGIFLGYLTGSKTPFVSQDLFVDDSGHFHFGTSSASEVRTAADVGDGEHRSAFAALDFTFDGTIGDSGALSGSLSGAVSAPLAATKSADGATSSMTGFYQAGAAGSSATTFTIVSPAGQVLVLTQTATGADAGTGTISTAGDIAVVTANNQTVSATLSSDASIAATVTSSTGQKTTFAGASDAVIAQQRFVNVSTRAMTTTGPGVTIAGLVIAGQDSKPILLRAVGPGLTTYGVSGVLAKPRIQLYQGGTLIATNTGWATAPNVDEIAAAAARVAAFPLSASSADSAMFVTLAPGAYSAIITGADGGTGVVLVEAYDASTPSPGQKMVNISTRAMVGSGDNVCIAGFVVTGSTPKRVLIRGVGPSLAQYGLSGVLAKPVLNVYRSGTVIASNTGWSTSADATQITAAAVKVAAFPFVSNDDSAILISLDPGSYSAVLSGQGGATGIGLVEVYEVP